MLKGWSAGITFHQVKFNPKAEGLRCKHTSVQAFHAQEPEFLRQPHGQSLGPCEPEPRKFPFNQRSVIRKGTVREQRFKFLPGLEEHFCSDRATPQKSSLLTKDCQLRMFERHICIAMPLHTLTLNTQKSFWRTAVSMAEAQNCRFHVLMQYSTFLKTLLCNS